MRKPRQPRQPREPRQARRAFVDEDIFGDAAPPVNVEHEPVTLPPVVETVVVSETVPSSRENGTGRNVAGKVSSVHLEDAMQHWGLESADVLAWRGAPEEDLVIVTAGGQKLHWPADMDRQLTDSEKGRAVPQPTGHPGGVGRFTED